MFLFEEYPEQYIVLRNAFMQYDMKWQQKTKYKIC